jgi:hypothetical protein
MDDSEYCWDRAMRWTELANNAADPQLRKVLLVMAAIWFKAAAEGIAKRPVGG